MQSSPDSAQNPEQRPCGTSHLGVATRPARPTCAIPMPTGRELFPVVPARCLPRRNLRRIDRRAGFRADEGSGHGLSTAPRTPDIAPCRPWPAALRPQNTGGGSAPGPATADTLGVTSGVKSVHHYSRSADHRETTMIRFETSLRGGFTVDSSRRTPRCRREQLPRYVDASGHFDGTVFHRVISAVIFGAAGSRPTCRQTDAPIRNGPTSG